MPCAPQGDLVIYRSTSWGLIMLLQITMKSRSHQQTRGTAYTSDAYNGIFGPKSRQNPQRCVSCGILTLANPELLTTNCSPSRRSGAPGTSGDVSFRAFGSPVTKNDENAPKQ